MGRLQVLLPALAVAVLTAAPAYGLPACRSAPCSADRGRPVAILTYYRPQHYADLVRAVRRAHLPAGTPIYHGGYWGREPGARTTPPPRPRRPPPPMPGGRRAPMFSLHRTDIWSRRRISRRARRALTRSGERGFTGRVPAVPVLLRRGSALRYRWGLELGRRYRDRIRQSRAHGGRIVTWQLDELQYELQKPGGWRLRGFTSGVLRGLTFGRRPLGDRRLPGIVWSTGAALELARRPAGAGLRRFWRLVDRCSIYLVGEEYVDFTGSPAAAAAKGRGWQAALWRGGGARRSLARKYVVGLTPGYRGVQGLGGNVDHHPRAAVRRWRRAYVRARLRTRPAGISQYNFLYGNAVRWVMNDAVEALGSGLRRLARG